MCGYDYLHIGTVYFYNYVLTIILIYDDVFM